MLEPGQLAPRFSLPDADMQMVELASFLGRKNVVLFFYPRDNSPGGALEAAQFSDHSDQFGRCNAVILGISRDDCLSHAEFRDRHGLSICLLSDSDGDVCRQYDVLREKETEGVRRECVLRSTFVIDRKGVIRHAAYGVNPRNHAAEIYDVVRRLKKP
jgi:peroxiredoxin Q/BCP